jgi:hypothetical protein
MQMRWEGQLRRRETVYPWRDALPDLSADALGLISWERRFLMRFGRVL